jgi:hypothetical protein
MIISHTNKSIIMRTPKTGSTTLETAIRMSVKTNEGDFASKQMTLSFLKYIAVQDIKNILNHMLT